MANGEFKGRNVSLDDIKVGTSNGVPVVNVSAQLVDDDGVVHAITRHTFMVNDDPAGNELAAVLKSLLAILVDRIERAHFSVTSSSKEQVIHGIAETIGGTSGTGTPGEIGTQG